MSLCKSLLYLILLLAAALPVRGQLPVSPTPLVEILAPTPANLPKIDSAVIQMMHPHSFVLANRSDKAIIGLFIRWSFNDSSGQPRLHDLGSDSYRTPRFHPLVPAHDRLLVAPGTFVLESLTQMPHVGASVDTLDGRMDADITRDMKVVIKIDSVIFEDGEVVGPNEFRYDTEIENRKIAATQLAKQIHNAMDKGDDPNVLFEHILETKVSSNDFVAKWTNIYASSMKGKSKVQFDTRLQALENLPEPPKFFHK